jgi:hypothetical protein
MFLTVIEFATIIASLHWYYGSKLFNDKHLINSTEVFGQKIIFFANFGGEKTTFVCEKTISMLSFFSQRLPNWPSRGVTDSLSRFSITIIDRNLKEILSSFFDLFYYLAWALRSCASSTLGPASTHLGRHWKCFSLWCTSSENVPVANQMHHCPKTKI